MLHLWQDHEVLAYTDRSSAKREERTTKMSCYRERRTVYGDYYSGPSRFSQNTFVD